LKQILILLILSTFLTASITTQEQQAFLCNLAKKVNHSLEARNRFPSTKTRIKSLKMQDNYTLDINYEASLTDFTLKEKYHNLHQMQAKKKFCTDEFFARMKNGLVLDIYHYNHNNQLITSFSLNQTTCLDTNKKLKLFLTKK